MKPRPIRILSIALLVIIPLALVLAPPGLPSAFAVGLVWIVGGGVILADDAEWESRATLRARFARQKWADAEQYARRRLEAMATQGD